MNHGKPVCVLPSPTEIELGTIAGAEPGTAIRVRVEPSPTPGLCGAGSEGYVRIEQLAWSADLGWYTQKSFVVPASMIKALVTELRKADCHIPHRAGVAEPVALRFPGLDQPPHDESSDPVRREA